MENAKEIKFEPTTVAVGTDNALFSSFASSWTAVHHHQQRQHQQQHQQLCSSASTAHHHHQQSSLILNNFSPSSYSHSQSRTLSSSSSAATIAAFAAAADEQQPSRTRTASLTIGKKRKAPSSTASVTSASTSSRQRRTRGQVGGPSKPKRKKPTDKERERNLEIKARLQELTEMMPFIGNAELSRIRILRLVNRYILHLWRILQGQQIFCQTTGQWRQLEKIDFAHIVNTEMSVKNSYSHRLEDDNEADEEEEEALAGTNSSGSWSKAIGGEPKSADEQPMPKFTAITVDGSPEGMKKIKASDDID